jgi:hypothetical protein
LAKAGPDSAHEPVATIVTCGSPRSQGNAESGLLATGQTGPTGLNKMKVETSRQLRPRECGGPRSAGEPREVW